MKPDPKQLQAVQDQLNRTMYLVSSGRIADSVIVLDDLAEALEEMDRKNKLKPVTTPAEPDTGAWQEAKTK